MFYGMAWLSTLQMPAIFGALTSSTTYSALVTICPGQ